MKIKFNILKRSFWIFSIIAIITAGIYFILFFGLQPKTVPKIKLSSTESPFDFGIFTHHRLRQELTSIPIILLGLTPNRDEEVNLSQGFIKNLKNQQPNLFIIVDSLLPLKEKILSDQEIDLSSNSEKILEILKETLKHKKQILILTSISNSSHLIPKNIVNYIRSDKIFESALAISVTDFSMSKSEIEKMSSGCENTNKNDLKCNDKLISLIQSKALSILYKKKQTGHFIGTLDQVGLNDYLVLFRKNL